MNVQQRMQHFIVSLLSLFTVYDVVLQAYEMPTVGGTLLLKTLVHRQRKLLEMLVPMTMWHVYRAEVPLASWSFCLILVVRQALQGLDEDRILDQIHSVGPVILSLAYSLPTYAIYVLYIVDVAHSANSRLGAVAQAFLFMLPDILAILSKAQQMYHADGVAPPSRNRLPLLPTRL